VKREQEGRPAFLKRKKQKTFGRFGFGAAGDAQPRGSKVLVLFFKKRTAFFRLSSLRPIFSVLAGQVPRKNIFLPIRATRWTLCFINGQLPKDRALSAVLVLTSTR
jgi:hypothetical protein